MKHTGLRSVISASFLFLVSTASAVYAQSVSVPFPEGFIGTVGSSNNSATNIRIFSTLEIDRATFSQPSTSGQFTAQGNDIPGTLRLTFDDGTVIDVPGAINWRDTQGSTLHAFGFIPNPLNPPRTITYGSSNQFSMTLDATSNYGLRIIGSSQTYSDGSSVSGNAATNGLLTALNSYLATVQASGPQITGPSGTAGAATSAKTVNENQTAVATLTANRTVTWSIQGGTDAGKFTINPTTGAITFAAAPDFEAPSDSDANNTYIVTILATDANGYTSQQTVTVTVADIDEAAPLITGPSGMPGAAASAKSVIEGTTAVATLAANEPVTWSIVGGADQSMFTINASTGALTFIAAPDYEIPSDSGTNNVYDLVVKAVDAASNASQQSVAVTVLDLDEVAPQITGPSGGAGAASSAKFVNEGATTVATFTADEGVTWSITGGADAGKFAVNPATGALTFLVAPDFETPADSGTNNVYDVVLTATDAANNTSTQAVAVTVLDLDDTAPVLTGPTTKSVPENQTAVDTYSADEPVTWVIVGGADAAKFSIHPSTGVLTFVAAPDFEAPTDGGTNNVYDVLLKATDGAGNTAQRAVAVTVTDLDDTAPAITGPSGGAGVAASAKSVNEGVTAVHVFTASEGAIWSITGGADQGLFAINPATGDLTLMAAPDFEAPTDANIDNDYVVEITATDSTGNASQQTLTVTVLKLDDTGPVITGPSGGAGSGTAAKAVPEGTQSVHSFTSDEGVTWAIVGGTDQGRFTINPGTGELRFASGPDFETPVDANTDNVYLVTVQATDGNGNTSQQVVTISVTDVAEDVTPPAITGPAGAAGDASVAKTVDEGQTAVATFAADEVVTWSITGGSDQGRFAISPSTGALTFVAAPDYEAAGDTDGNNIYLVVVTATDGFGNASHQTVTITVADLNEDATPPAIGGPSGAAGDAASVKAVPEGTIAVHAFSAGEPVTWALVGGHDQGQFTINPTTGALTFVAAPDYEQPTDSDTNNTYVLIVEARDANGNTSQQTLTVTVLDLDEVAPQITGPSGGAGAVASAKSVNEGVTAIHIFTANETVTWSLTGGPDQSRFAIDPATGALRFLAAPDFEAPTDVGTDNRYDLVITATDSRGNVTTQAVAVTVLDVNEDTAPPAITGPSGGAAAANSAERVDEGVVQATTFAANEAVTWSIQGGPDAGRFALDPNTGALTFVAPPDFEAPADANRDNAYVLIIAAADTNGNVSQQIVTITVGDLTEGTPPVVTGPDGTLQEQSQRIPEGRTLVATFHSDEPVTWSLASRGDAGAFRIDPVTGELRFRRAPEFDTPADMDGDNVYLLTVIAMDAEGNMTEIVFAVTVEDTVAPQISGPSGRPGAGRSATSVDEGTTTAATFTANETVTWSIAGGVDAAHFGMDPTTGELRFVIAPDFEDPKDQDADNSYVVVVTATDANGNVSQQTVTVRVANVTDTPSELFEERRDEVEAIVRDVEENHLRAAVAAQQDTTRSARDRFIEGQRLRELCRDIDDPSQPVTSALRNNDECSLLATRSDVALDADGTLEVGEGGINGAGTFFGQHGSFDGTRRRIVEGTFQLVDDGEGVETVDVRARIAWERLVSDDVMLGTFVGGDLARSDVDRQLSGSVDKMGFSFGTYIVAEPVQNLYLDGFLSMALGRNEVALGDDELELEGDYRTRSLLVGGALSGIIEREHFEIRPELSVAYGMTDIGDLTLDATAFGITDEVSASIDGVDYTTVRFTPEFLLPLQRLSNDAALVVAPSLACEWTADDRACGGGLRLGLRGTSHDGLTSWTIALTAEQLGNSSRTGLEAGLEQKF